MVEIIIAETEERQGQYSAHLGDRLLVKASRQPMLDAARILLSEDYSPEDMIEMRRANRDTLDLRSRIGAAAKLTVAECDRDPPRFRRWKAFQGREGRSYSDYSARQAITVPSSL